MAKSGASMWGPGAAEAAPCLGQVPLAHQGKAFLASPAESLASAPSRRIQLRHSEAEDLKRE